MYYATRLLCHPCFVLIRFVFLCFLFRFAAPAPITEAPLDLAKKCDSEECVLPYCFCSKDGTIVPGGLDPEDVSTSSLNLFYSIFFLIFFFADDFVMVSMLVCA